MQDAYVRSTGLAWRRVAPLVRIAYERVAPAQLASRLEKTPSVPAPKQRITVADIDPNNTPRGKQILASLRKICLALPETSEGAQFGHPASAFRTERMLAQLPDGA